MRVLTDVSPTPEQLPLLAYRPGFTLIRGAAGSGKTTTAVLRLQFVTGVWRRERDRVESPVPVRVLVLTYNRTLRGYVQELVEQKVSEDGLDLTLSTFGRWGREALGQPEMLDKRTRESELWRRAAGLRYEKEFLLDEVEYILGRFPPDKLGDYANPDAPTYDRRGRGAAPRVERSMRERILSEVIDPFLDWKHQNGYTDWSDIAVRMATGQAVDPYDIVLIDEAQDFSANQIRGVVRHLAETHSTAFVLDAVQQIYPHGFRWNEAGVAFGGDVHRLEENHRNTKQVAAFALPLVRDLPIEDDGTLPDFDSCTRDGETPAVVRGRFSDQMDWVIDRLKNTPDGESTALLHAKGGGWFSYVEQRLAQAGIPYVQMARRSEWPQGNEQVGLCTLHSAKGLEFDHVVILGLNGGDLLPHGTDEDDGQLANHRRLVAMGVGRARESVAVTYKPDEASRVVEFLDPATYELFDL